MIKEPTPIDKQIDFINQLRESFDSEERQRIAMIRSPEETAQLLRDIHENLIGVRLWNATKAQLNEMYPGKQQFNGHVIVVDVCGDCAKPLTTANLADNERYDVVLDKREIVCVPCADKRLERLENSSMGIP